MLWPLLISPASLKALLLIIVHQVLLMPSQNWPSVISISCHWLKQVSWLNQSHEAEKYVIPIVESLEKYVAKGMNTRRDKGPRLKTQPTTPGYVWIYMILCFSNSWLFSVPSHTDFKIIGTLTLLLIIDYTAHWSFGWAQSQTGPCVLPGRSIFWPNSYNDMFWYISHINCRYPETNMSSQKCIHL